MLGILAYYIIFILNQKFEKRNITKLFFCVVILYFFINIKNYNDLVFSNINLNKKEKEYGIEIENYIEQYEFDFGNKVDELVLVYDFDKTQYFNNEKRFCIPNQSGYFCGWSSREIINYYTNRHLNLKEEINKDQIDFLEDYKIIDGVLYIRVHKF